MNFVIQTIDRQIKHDFAGALLVGIEYSKWSGDATVNYISVEYDEIPLVCDWLVPIGSVEFVQYYMEGNNYTLPKPRNVPDQLIGYAGRKIINGTRKDVLHNLPCFIKSTTKIKSEYNGAVEPGYNSLILPQDDYQISELVNIDSEWRAFVFKNKLVGLQNYLGDFTLFPDVGKINEMIQAYTKGPVAYTLDVYINADSTYVMEVHDFYSVGFYGFSDFRIIPAMFAHWYYQYVRGIKKKNDK